MYFSVDFAKYFTIAFHRINTRPLNTHKRAAKIDRKATKALNQNMSLRLLFYNSTFMLTLLNFIYSAIVCIIYLNLNCNILFQIIIESNFAMII